MAVYVTEEDLKRLSTITEYTESSEDEDVKYFLVDDSPMAKFSRSIKWAYKKVREPMTTPSN